MKSLCVCLSARSCQLLTGGALTDKADPFSDIFDVTNLGEVFSKSLKYITVFKLAACGTV